MNQKVKILFPLDFSNLASSTLETAEYFARTYDAELFLLHVIEAPSGPAKLFSSFDEEEARKAARKMLNEFIEQHAEKGLNIDSLIKIGKPYRKIIEAACEIDASIIVMGTHGTDGMLQDMLTGSNASRVIKGAPCPVLTIREQPKIIPFQKILLPIDLTLETGEKIDVAIELAEHFKSDLAVMSVHNESDEDITNRLKKRLDKAVEHIQKHGIEVESSLLVTKREDITTAVMNFAKEIGADMLCIMTQQEMNLKEAFMGSNAGRIVNHSPIPVYSIKPQKEYRAKTFANPHFN